MNVSAKTRRQQRATPANKSAFLHMLADAPASALAEDLRRMEEEHAANPEHLTASYYAALRVRELLERRSRRERELASLYATARELTALRPVDQALSAMVAHAHDLIAADVTYLSVFDEAAGDLRVRATAGSVSEDFQKIHMPPGTGIASRVAKTRTPYWASDFQNAKEISHDPDIDRAVAAEGLKSLLCVPLLAYDRVIGVLFAGNRVERSFNPDEVALLSAFAGHAAIALENARLFDQRRQAIEELKQARTSVEDQLSAVERAEAVHDALTNIVLQGGTATDVAELLVETLGGAVIIVDRNDDVIAHRDGSARNEQPRQVNPDFEFADSVRAAVATSRRTGHSVNVDLPRWGTCTITAVVAGDTYLGALILTHSETRGPVKNRTFERAAHIMALLTLQQDALVNAEERVRGELLADLLTAPQAVSPELLLRGKSRGIKIDDLNTAIVVMRPHNEQPSEVVRLLHGLQVRYSGLAGEYQGLPILLLHADSSRQIAQNLYTTIKCLSQKPVLVCAGPVVRSAAELPKSFITASRCSHLLRQIGIQDRAAATDEFAIYSLLFDTDRDGEVRRFLDETLGALSSHDAERGTQLIETLAKYFANSGNLARTARALKVHKNTLLKRMERLSEILGANWQEPETALRLQLAVHLTELIEGRGIDH